MKILFYTSCKAIAMKGGTERATVSVASALSSRYGHECYSAYSIEDSAPKELCFAGELMVDGHLKTAASQIASFVQDRRVDVVVSQGSFELVIALRKAGLPRCTKLVLAHHFEPGWEVHFGDLRTCLSQLGSASGTGKVKPAVMVLCYPIYKARYTRRLRGDYQAAYMAADAVVLLSEGFSEGYKAFGGLEDVEKFRFIPNPLSCEEYLDPAAYCEKKKIALIVARLEDTPKKISLALKAWEAVKSDPVSEGWTLRIVGHGRDESRYKRLAARMRLPDVDFVGRRDPIEGGDYCIASLFLMTSASEGWGLTLMEAQQFGAVPVAFDSYASLREIITDGENGRYVPFADVSAYAKAVLELMEDAGMRQEMALYAIESSKRFSWGAIAEKWQALLEELGSL